MEKITYGAYSNHKVYMKDYRFVFNARKLIRWLKG